MPQVSFLTIATITEGETARLTFPLEEDGAALNGTGFTVTDLVLTASSGEAIDTVGNFGWISDAAGTVYYDPDAADFIAAKSPYRVKVKITDGSSKVRFYPNHIIAQIVVVPVR